jgi:hypothetical protein
MAIDTEKFKSSLGVNPIAEKAAQIRSRFEEDKDERVDLDQEALLLQKTQAGGDITSQQPQVTTSAEKKIDILGMFQDGLSDAQVQMQSKKLYEQGYKIDPKDLEQYNILSKQRENKRQEFNKLYDEKLSKNKKLLGEDIDPFLREQLEQRGMSEQLKDLEKTASKASGLKQFGGTLKEMFIGPVGRALSQPFVEVKSGVEQLVPGGRTGLEPTKTPFGEVEPTRLTREQFEQKTGATSGELFSGAAEVGLTFIPISRMFAPVKKVTGPALAKLQPVINKIRGNAGSKVDMINRLAGKIAQGKKADIKPVINALKKIDVTGVKNYDELATVTGEEIATLSKRLDDFLLEDKRVFDLSELKRTIQAGDEVVEINYVEDALNHLEELYGKTTEPGLLAQVKQLKSKAVSEGLTVQEVNNIAKVYGYEFGTKAFSKRTGEALTSVNAQKYENVRKGVKDAARNLIDSDLPKELDSQVSNMFDLKRLAEINSDKANSVLQKVDDRNIVQQLFRAAGKGFDVATFGGPREFLKAVMMESNIGKKSSNALAIEEALSKNLKQLDKLLDKPKAEVESFFLDLIKNNEVIIQNLVKAVDDGE